MEFPYNIFMKLLLIAILLPSFAFTFTCPDGLALYTIATQSAKFHICGNDPTLKDGKVIVSGKSTGEDRIFVFSEVAKGKVLAPQQIDIHPLGGEDTIYVFSTNKKNIKLVQAFTIFGKETPLLETTITCDAKSCSASPLKCLLVQKIPKKYQKEPDEIVKKIKDPKYGMWVQEGDLVKLIEYSLMGHKESKNTLLGPVSDKVDGHSGEMHAAARNLLDKLTANNCWHELKP